MSTQLIKPINHQQISSNTARNGYTNTIKNELQTKGAFEIYMNTIVAVKWMEEMSQPRTGGCTGLTSGTIYFSTGQYRCTVSGLPLFFIFIEIYIYIYLYVCMYVCMYMCVYIIIHIKVYHKTLPQFKTNYSQFQTLASIKRKKKKKKQKA